MCSLPGRLERWGRKMQEDRASCHKQIWPCTILCHSPSFNCREPWFLELQTASRGCNITLILFVSGWGHSHTFWAGARPQWRIGAATECCSKPLGTAAKQPRPPGLA